MTRGELHPAELAIKSICPPVIVGAQVYKVFLDSPTDVNGEVECRLIVTHRSGCWWTVWRSFFDLLQLHDILKATFDGVASLNLPASEKSLIPNFTQPSDINFLERSCLDLQAFLDEVLGREDLARHPAVQLALGVVRPEPPSGLRVVARVDEHELEIRPEELNLTDDYTQSDAQGAPVDGYFVDIMHVETGASYQVARDIGCGGSQPVRAVVGTLAPGLYRFTVWALNLAGASLPIEVTIDASGIKRLADPSMSSEVHDSSSLSLGCTWRIIVPSHPQHAMGLAPSDTHTTIVTDQVSAFQNPGVVTPRRRALPEISSVTGLYSVASQADLVTTQTNIVATPRRRALLQKSPSESLRSFASQANTLATPRSRTLRQLSRVESLCFRATRPDSTPSQQRGVVIRPISRNSRVYSVGPTDPTAPKIAVSCQGVSHAHIAPGRPTFAVEGAFSIQRVSQESTSIGVAGTRVAQSKLDVAATDENACVICLSEQKTHAFMPCGHLCVCGSCGQAVLRLPPSLIACPMCRVMAVNAIHIYT